MKNKIYSLVINPGSTSTKIAFFINQNVVISQTIYHSNEELKKYPNIISQTPFRKQIILQTLTENNINISKIDYFVGRGGLLRPLKSGTYLVNDQMIDDLVNEKYGSHASNLGAIIAYDFAKQYKKLAFIVDPVVVDELSDIARISGLKEIKRRSIFHALNHKSIAKNYAKAIEKKYEELNLIIAHLGGGISIGLHQKGKVIDVNDALGGEGPFSPERAGGLPVNQIVDMCFSGNYTKQEIMRKLIGDGGLVSYLGTNDGVKVRQMIYAGDKEANFYLEAMAYQIVKEIGGLYFAAKGEIDAVILTGGSAHNEILIKTINEYLGHLVKVVIMPGENEMQALVEGLFRVLNKEEEIMTY